MTRVLMTAAVWLAVLSPASAGTAAPDLKVVRDGERRIVTVRAGELTVQQTLTSKAFDLRIVSGTDDVRFSADLEGRVVVERDGQRRTLSMRVGSVQDHAAMKAMLMTSPALEAFDALMQSAWAQTFEPVQVLRSAREVVRVLQQDQPPIEFIAKRQPAPVASLVRVRQPLSPAQCWDTYARDVIYFTYELESCLDSASHQWWNPLATAWCSYEYNLKTSLSAVWLLDCYGVVA